MGASGAGTTTVARAVADHWPFRTLTRMTTSGAERSALRGDGRKPNGFAASKFASVCANGRVIGQAAWAAFQEWGRGYDDPAFEGRSRVAHETWLAGLDGPVLRLDSASPPEVLRDEVLVWDSAV